MTDLSNAVKSDYKPFFKFEIVNLEELLTWPNGEYGARILEIEDNVIVFLIANREIITEKNRSDYLFTVHREIVEKERAKKSTLPNYLTLEDQEEISSGNAVATDDYRVKND